MRRLLLLCVFAAIPLLAKPHVFDTSKTLHFVLEDHLEHPFYWWPRTLLSYPVQFEAAGVSPRELTLTDEKGNAQAFQLSEVKLRQGRLLSATVNFFSDLPSGGRHDFVLRANGPAPPLPAQVTEHSEQDAVVLNSGVMKVRLPVTQTVSGNVPGPILQVSRGGGWIGNSKLVTPGYRVLRIAATRLENGPLFITYRVVYDLEHGARYAAIIRCLGGMDYVEFHEEAQGLPKDEGVYLEMSWTGFHPTYRQSPNNPYVPGRSDRPQKRYKDYPWERIDDPQLNTHLGVVSGMTREGEIGFRLGLFQPWPAFLVGSFANFWDAKSNDALGVFIDKVAAWQDNDYAIWHASTKLEVHYFYRDGVLSWRWPLATGKRSTCIAAYDHAKDIAAMHDMERMHAGKKGDDGFLYSSNLSPTSYMLFMQNRHGLLDLNEVKDWVLAYPDNARRPPAIFCKGSVKEAADLERRVLTSALIGEAAASGTRQNGGFGPTQGRQVDDWWVDAYNRFYPRLDQRQRHRLNAAFLLTAYLHAGEDYMPMVPMLSGHPNFLSDVKSIPALMTFLFPEHPDASLWADEFRKYVELNSHYHTRPPVARWDAQGGRWTESISTYVWGFFRPALRAAYLLQQFDGENRFVTPELAEVGNWLVDSLSAPFVGEEGQHPGVLPVHQWGTVTVQNGPRRVYPPIGAHSARRMPPRALWYFGTLLQRFDPLTAEHLMWAARPTDQDVEKSLSDPDPWRLIYQRPDNRGTNPHLVSTKYTGYGLVLRAGVDTPHEVSVHLQQIDRGPNYRWGVAGEDGNGVIFYYADGKAYSHNGTEDFGDRAEQDTDFCTNFGVFKDGKFRSIGPNVLSQPFYDFKPAQFAELTSEKGPNAYSWPEYLSRSVMLVGNDYLVAYDAVFNQAVPHRFSWFNKQGDEFPSIQIVKGGSREQRTEVNTVSTRGVWYDGSGDSMVVVSHRKDAKVTPRPYGTRVEVNGSVDEIFQDPHGVRYANDGVTFEGTAGVVRRRGRAYELALFHGSDIGAGGVLFTVLGDDVGVSASFENADDLQGHYYAPLRGVVSVQSNTLPADAEFYIDGAKVNSRRNGDVLIMPLLPGRHQWQITAGNPVPLAPRVDHTENISGGAKVILSPVAGATEYRLEISRDSGASWTAAGVTNGTGYMLTGLQNGSKIHVRVIAANAAHASKPGPEYPIYVSDQPAPPPDGLAVKLSPQATRLSWGQVLGVTEYRLYRRPDAHQDFKLIYGGTDRRFVDHSAGKIFEYAIAAVNGKGEGTRSNVVTSDPSSWANFDPKPEEPFRRVSYAGTPIPQEPQPPAYYPK